MIYYFLIATAVFAVFLWASYSLDEYPFFVNFLASLMMSICWPLTLVLLILWIKND